MRYSSRLSLLLKKRTQHRPLSSNNVDDVVPSFYVAATRQHAGKTTVSLALMSGLQKKFNKVGFIKPIGEKSTVIHEHGIDVAVDKDAVLFKEHFQMDHVPWRSVSPVIIPPGYTRDYLDNKITLDVQKEKLKEAYNDIASRSELILCEGTGNCAVGSIVDASNADIAAWLGSPMVLVVNGGLGRSIDELTLNLTLCEVHNVPVAGVIVNQVQPDKFDQTMHYFKLAMQRKWPDIPVLGAVPDKQFLGCPALSELEVLLKGNLLTGREHSLRHYRVRRDLQLVADSLESFLQELRHQRAVIDDGHQRRTLFVCHASRNDILLGFLMEAQQNYEHSPRWQASLLMTGCADYPLSDQLTDFVTTMPNAPPVLITPFQTDESLELMYGYTAKLNAEDRHRVDAAIHHYEPHIDFDLLMNRITILKQKNL
ncbi:phosphate acetyltransferase [Fistulifera solaris]|uniref:Phosphate acetyltransferase n=1 Tax=Fistulifera solaris TaxID=1519565 RepID=A0A1Z5K042_FISSO|nr:phosphate acetyltransferase [Fistulifera solaris]|eukprot:GAX19663.1 phosphate acetyltransferase [Fistulifera solaris]